MNATISPSLDRRIATVRRFSRFYTRVIGALREGLLQSRFSLAEARVLYELAHRAEPTATELARDLEMDAGYLSRMLQAFERDGLLARSASGTDRRLNLLSLTASGAEAFAPLDARSRAEVGALLVGLSEPAQSDLIAAMQRIEALLGTTRLATWLLRQHRPGDIGWVIARHGALYADEYAFDHRFEALVAQVAGGFLAQHDPARERCWIAERDGVNVGSVFLVRKSDDMAKLRLLIVEPTARGLGIGRRMVDECIAFTRQAGYRGITLWTNDILLAARAIYQQAGFRLVASSPHCDFGPRCVGEDWELTLR